MIKNKLFIVYKIVLLYFFKYNFNLPVYNFFVL